MAHLLGVENLRLTVGSRLLLDEVTLGLEDGARVGVLGPNGAGKSTFLAALAGRREPDGGRVTRTGGVSVAVLSQADDLVPGVTVRTAIHGQAPEHEWASDPAVRDIHAGLIADLAPGQLGVIVTHGVAGRALAAALVGIELHAAWLGLGGLHNCHWVELTEGAHGWRIEKWNAHA